MGGSRRGIGIVAALVVSAIGGWLLARVTVETRAGEPDVELPVREPADPIARDAPQLASPGRAPSPAKPIADTRTEPLPADETPSNGLISPALERHAREGIARGWRIERGDDLPAATLADGYARFQQTVLTSPEEIGRELGRIQNELDEAATHGQLFLLLQQFAEGDETMSSVDLVSDGKAFARLFERRSQPSYLDGVQHLEKPDEAIVDGTTLQFPAGVFKVERLMRDKDPFPRDVTIQGAGMDSTLLLFGDLSTRNRLVDFAVRDCTVFLDDSLFDLRVEPASVVLDRVRMIGFDTGAGGSYLFSTHGIAVDARDCRFEGGYGRSPSKCRLFRYSGGDQLFRFQSCVFSRIELDLQGAREATLVFDHCILEDVLDRRREGSSVPAGVVLRGTSVEYYDWELGIPPRKDLNDLFPDWKARINQ